MSSSPNKTTGAATGATPEATATLAVNSQFVGASQLLASIKLDMNIKPEDISDQELLDMAIMFEKKHPECVSTFTK